MKNLMLKNLGLIALILLLNISFVQAKELWLQNIPVKKLQQLYQKSNYTGVKDYLMIPSYQYPSIFLKNFPVDFNTLTNETERNTLFIKILAPLALRLNQDLLAERKIISNIQTLFNQDPKLSAANIKILEEKAGKYDVFTRLKEQARYEYLISELLNRIDAIPPSILITFAAIETNWGTSRIVREGNSLYKMLAWHTNKGLKPIGEKEDDTYRIKTYPNLYASMQDFALKINSHIVFEDLREYRYERRQRSPFVLGTILAPHIYGHSPLKNYAGIFDYTLAYYELQVIDKSSLSDKIIPENLAKEFERYVTKM